MKCILCGQRKGRRSCPAKNALICQQCCGAKRVLEVDCPESCEYLISGRQREAEHAGARFYRTDTPAEHAKRARVLTEFAPVISQLQTVIAMERKAVRDLKDSDLGEALDCVLKTLRTEDNGVIYESTSGNLRAESLRRQISGAIEACRYPKNPQETRIQLKEAIECVEVLRSIVGSHIGAGPSSLSFVDFLIRHLPRDAEVGPAPPSIILPGR